MKKTARQLLKEIADCTDMNPELKNDILEVMSAWIVMENIIKVSGEHVFQTRFVTSGELEITQPELIKSLLGYNENEKADISFNDFFSSIHPDDIPDFSKMMEQFCNNKCACYTGIFRVMHRSGKYIWILGRANHAGIDEMTGKPRITGILIEVCMNFKTLKKLKILFDELMSSEEESNPNDLTLSEREIGKLIASGMINRDSASKLNMSLSSFNLQKRYIFKKTHTNNAASLAAYFIKHGLD